MKRSKKWLASAELINKDELYAPLEAMRIVKETATTKFDGTVNVAFALGCQECV
jgi:large subunit ribosomal protein L1